jgi:hypothetical protein
MEQYPTKDLTIDPQVAEEAIKRLAPEAVDEIGVDRLRTVRQILREYSDCKVDDEELYLLLDFFNWEMTGTRLHVYDFRRPWQDQIDWDLVKAMLEEQVPEALEKLGFDRLCTVTRMIKEYSEGNLTLDELTRLAVNYRFGLTDIPTTLVGDVAPGPAEGEVGNEIGRGVSRKQLTYEEYDHILLARRA